MALTQDAIDRLLAVKKHILEEPLRFDMKFIRDPNSKAPCGTTCCIAGWVIKLDKPEIVAQESEPEFWSSPDGSGDVSEACELLGLKGRQDYLFYHRNWPDALAFAYRDAETPAERAKAGADAIDSFIAAGGEW